MRINSNANVLNSLNNLQKSKDALRASLEKLSSGKKINKASDDPAGLIVSERMKAQISSIQQEIDNIDNTSNKYNTADGALNTLQHNLQDMRKIALSAANEGANSEEAQQAYQNSMDESVKSYNYVKESASFGTSKLLDGSEGSVAALEDTSHIDVSTAEKAEEAVNQIDEKLNEISTLRGEIGSQQKNDLQARKNNLETELTNLTASQSYIEDVDMAKEYATFVNKEIQLKAGMAMLAHQNQVPSLVIDFLK